MKSKIKYERTDNGTPRLELSSGCEDYPGCTLVAATRRRSLTIKLPQFIQPYRQWIDMSKYNWGKPGGGYWDVHQRRYGFYLFENHLYVSLGAQTDDSTTTQKWSCFLPWGEWRFVRFSLYGLTGEHFWTQTERPDIRGIRGIDKFEAQRKAEEACPKVRFRFIDFDGEIIEASTHIEEREWLRGEKWCSWLSLFYRPMVRRSLDIEFSKETGSRKGSWKGGTMGTGIDLLPGELHEAAFRRYCVKHNMSFIGTVITEAAA